jgi:hypothetical protein
METSLRQRRSHGGGFGNHSRGATEIRAFQSATVSQR